MFAVHAAALLLVLVAAVVIVWERPDFVPLSEAIFSASLLSIVGGIPAAFFTFLTLGSAILTRQDCPKHGQH